MDGTVIIIESDEETDVVDETKRDSPEEDESGETVIISESDEETDVVDETKRDSPEEDESGETVIISESDEGTDVVDETKRNSPEEYESGETVIIDESDEESDVVDDTKRGISDEYEDVIVNDCHEIRAATYSANIAYQIQSGGPNKMEVLDEVLDEWSRMAVHGTVCESKTLDAVENRNGLIEKHATLNKENSPQPGIDLQKRLAEWYNTQTSKGLVSPGQLERAVIVIAQCMGIKDFFPLKTFLQTFVEKQGLYYHLNGKRLLFKKAAAGLLKHLFEAIFEVWYHEWPTSIDELLTSESKQNPLHFINYLVALTEWHVESCAAHVPNDVTPKAIKEKEILYAKSILGMKSAGEYKKSFGNLSSNVLCVTAVDIRSFSTEISCWYCSRNYPVPCEHLLREADSLAETIGMSHFTATRAWARRFAQLTSVHSLASIHSILRPKDPRNYFPWDPNDFDCSFQKWFGDLVTLPIDNENVKTATKLNKVQGPKLLNSGDTGTVSGQSVGTGSKQNTGLDDDGGQTELDDELGKWYNEQIKTRLVERNELQVKAIEIAQHQRQNGFNPTRNWMKSFLMHNGLHFIDECDGKLKWTKISSDYYDFGEFSRIFNSWYVESTITIHTHSEKRPALVASGTKNEKTPNMLLFNKDRGGKRQQTFPNPQVRKRSKLPSSVSVRNQAVRNPNHCNKLPSLVSPGSQNKETPNMLPVKKDEGKNRLQTFHNPRPSKPALLRTWFDLDTAVHKWYIEQSSFLVVPGDLERKTAEMVGHLPSKVFSLCRTWTESFIDRHGLFIYVNGNRELFLKPTFEFLKYKYEGEFEVWYNQWPLTLKESLLKDDRVCFKPYEDALLIWYLKESKTNMISEWDIKNMSDAIIKREMHKIKLEDADEWTKLWGRKYLSSVLMIRAFDSALSKWYHENVKKCSMTPDALRIRADRAAKEIGFSKFRATRTWLIRFAERHGFEFEEGSLDSK